MENNYLMDKIKELRLIISDLVHDFKVNEEYIDGLLDEIKEFKAEIKRLKMFDDVIIYQENMDELKTKNELLKKDMDNLINNNKYERKENNHLRKINSHMAKEKKELQAENNTLESSLKDCVNDYEELKAEIKEVRNSKIKFMSKAQDEILERLSIIRKLKAENETLKKENDSLKRGEEYLKECGMLDNY